MKQSILGGKAGYLMRRARPEDAECYYLQNYCPLDRETARLTGCKEAFTREEVLQFFSDSLEDPERAFFLIIAPDGRIAGECVINEINRKLRCANFRIAIFHPQDRGRGIGLWAVKLTRDYAFEQLRLHRLELDVYSFNPRAEKTYLKAGFKREGVLRHAVMDGGQYADVILMAILEDEWKKEAPDEAAGTEREFPDD